MAPDRRAWNSMSVAVGDERLYVARVERICEAALDLDVLLRHGFTLPRAFERY
jgi:hypothetical protein